MRDTEKKKLGANRLQFIKIRAGLPKQCLWAKRWDWVPCHLSRHPHLEHMQAHAMFLLYYPDRSQPRIVRAHTGTWTAKGMLRQSGICSGSSSTE